MPDVSLFVGFVISTELISIVVNVSPCSLYTAQLSSQDA